MPGAIEIFQVREFPFPRAWRPSGNFFLGFSKNSRSREIRNLGNHSSFEIFFFHSLFFTGMGTGPGFATRKIRTRGFLIPPVLAPGWPEFEPENFQNWTRARTQNSGFDRVGLTHPGNPFSKTTPIIGIENKNFGSDLLWSPKKFVWEISISLIFHQLSKIFKSQKSASKRGSLVSEGYSCLP